jgi:hypothetical protein
MTEIFYNIDARTQYNKTFSALFTQLLAYLPKSDSGYTTNCVNYAKKVL